MENAAAAHPIIVFDVNETLLDINFLNPLFARIFGAEHIMREWFAQTILYTGVLTLSGAYAPFGALGAATLQMLGEIRQAEVTEADLAELRLRMGALPPHPEVPDALRHLKEAGFRLVTLTNSTAEAQAAQLDHAGIAGCFERQFSVDTVHRYKPAPETYRMVAQALGVEMPALCLVAAHSWDTLGAQKQGCAAALVTRSGNAALPIAGLPQPQIKGPDLTAIAEQIIRRWSA